MIVLCFVEPVTLYATAQKQQPMSQQLERQPITRALFYLAP